MLKSITKFITSHPINQIFNLGKKQVEWKKVNELQAGMGIAIENNGKLDWDEIVSIKKVRCEQVYDVEVEGTHNFVGNGILAHNTYISGNVGIGTTAPSYKLDINGSLGVGGTATFNNKVKIADGTQSNGYVFTSDSNGIGSWSDISTVGGVSGTGTDNFVPRWDGTTSLQDSAIYAADDGSIGIGTSDPSEQLEVSGSIYSNGGWIEADSGYGFGWKTPGWGLMDLIGEVNHKIIFRTNFEDRVAIDSSGSVGIGTTSPSYTIHTVIPAGAQYAANGLFIDDSLTQDSLATIWLKNDEKTWFMRNSGANGDYFQIGIGSTSPVQISYNAAPLSFYINSAETVLNESAVDRDFRVESSNSASALFLEGNTGNVGIGTSSPGSYKLNVIGNGYFSTNLGVGSTATINTAYLTGALLDKDAQAGTSGQVLSSTATGIDWIDSSSLGIGGSGTTNYLAKWSGDDLTNSLIFDNGTNLGIGTTNPTAMLHVIDDIRAEKFIDDTNTNYYLDPAASSISLITAGNIGIGTTAPDNTLDVVGTLDVSGASTLNAITVDANANFIMSSGTGVIRAPWSVGGVNNASIGFYNSATNYSQWYLSGGYANFMTYYTSGVKFGTADANPVHFLTNNTEQVTILSSGNVGIGTTSPTMKLQIGNGTEVVNMALVSSDSSWYYMYEDGTAAANGRFAFGYHQPNDNFQISRYNSGWLDALVVNRTTGNVGIGTTAPGYKLTLVSSGTATFPFGIYASDGSNLFNVYEDASGYGRMDVRDSGGGVAIQLNSNGSSYFNSGNVGIGTTNPLAALEIGGSGNVRIGGLTASSAVYTDANKQLTSTIPSSGTLGYWQKNSTLLSPATITDNLSIGSTAPASAMFYVPGTTNNNAWFNLGTGNVGIGTTAPVSKLFVAGDIRLTGELSARGYVAKGHAGAGKNNLASGITATGSGGSSSVPTDGSKTVGSGYLQFGSGSGTGTGSESSYVQIDLGASKTVSQHKIYFYNGDNRYYWFKLKYSYDGTNWHYAVGNTDTWVTSASNLPGSGTSGQIGYVTDVAVDTVTARYWRIYADGNSINTANHIYEWEISQELNPVALDVDDRLYVGGNVGIGTTGPNFLLEIQKTSTVASAVNSLLTVSYDISDAQSNGNKFTSAVFSGDITEAGMGYMRFEHAFDSTTAKRWSAIQAGTNYGVYGDGPGPLAGDTGYLLLNPYGGNVGIGTTGPTQKLNIVSGVAGLPATTGTAQNGGFALEGTSNSVLYMGNAGSPYSAWIQVSNKTGLQNNYSLLLNPNGGNVGIGTTNPTTKLEVSGNITLTASGGKTITTPGTELILTETGDQFGEVSLTLRNRNGMNGALFTNAAIDLIDFGFKPSIGDQNNIRLNHIAALNVSSLNTTEFQFLPASAGSNADKWFASGANATIIQSGNVGISDTTPTYKLDVNGTGRFTGALELDSTLVDVNNSAGTSGQVLSSTVTGTDWVDISSIGIGGSGTINYLPKFTGGTTLGNSVIYETSGNVGIGTTVPTAMLHVIDDIRAEKFIDDTNTNYYLDPAASSISLITAGNIGIGTTNPTQALEAAGIIKATNGANGIKIGGYGTTASSYAISNSLSYLSFNTDAGAAQNIKAGSLAITSNFGTGAAPANGLYVQGSVGIGITAPGNYLDVYGANKTPANTLTTTTMALVSTTAQGIDRGGTIGFGGYIDDASTTLRQFAAIGGRKEAAATGGQNGYLGFFTNNGGAMTEWMRVASGGNVGIGTTVPGQKLDVAGNITLTGSIIGDATDSLRLRAGGVGVGATGTSNIFFESSTGTVAGRLDTSTVGGSETRDANQLTTDTETADIFYATGGSATYFTGQSFSTGATAGSLSKIIFNLKRTGATTSYNTWVEIYRANDSDYKPTGPALGTSDFVAASTIDTSLELITFTFTNRPYLSASTRYVAIIKASAPSDGSNKISANYAYDNSTDFEANQTLLVSSDGGTTWTTYNTAGNYCDLYFDEYYQNQYGTLYIGSVNTSAADLAENYASTQSLQAGEIVIHDPDRDQGVIRSLAEYDSSMMGVVSTSPGLLLGSKENSNSAEYPIALSGRVPIRVSLSNGAIKIGDAITSSPIAGIGMKATSPGPIVAKALQNLESCNDQYCTIMAFITLQYHQPQPWVSDNGQVVILENYNSTGDYLLADQNGETLSTRVENFTKSMIATLESGLIKTQDLIVNRKASIKELDVEQLAINEQPIDEYINQVIDQRSEEVAPVGTDPTPTPTDPSQPTQLGQLLTESIDTTTLLSQEITTQDLEAQTILTQQLDADQINAHQIEANSARIAALQAGMAEFESVKAVTAELTTATVSGTLYANHIDKLDEQIALALQQPGLLEILSGQTSTIDRNDQLLAETVGIVESANFDATSSADLNLTLADLGLVETDAVISGQAAFIENYLKVNGSAYIADSLGIGNQLLLGDRLQITDNYLAFVPDPSTPELNTFYIQPSGKGTLALMANLLILDETGQVSINGDVSIAGNTTVEGTLLAGLLQPDDFGNPFQVQVAGLSASSGEVQDSRFEIIDETGTPVATISAQGKANFAGGIGVDSQDLRSPTDEIDALNATNSATSVDTAQLETSKTSGTALVRAGESQVTIVASSLTAQSLIYITPVGSTNNQVLYVKSQQAPDAENNVSGQFTVGFDALTQVDVEFNWWIVN